VIDTAIELFSKLLPLQSVHSTVKVITQLVDSVRAPKLERNAGRKAAVFVNATVALVLTLRYATMTHFRQAKDIFGNIQITTLLSPFLMVRSWQNELLIN
jgi:hypothetical protein